MPDESSPGPFIESFRRGLRPAGQVEGKALTLDGGSAPRAAEYVHRILKGARPGDLPIHQPTRYKLLVNAKTAQSPGLTIPQAVLQREDEAIR